MITITKKEAEFLRENNYSDYVKKSFSKHPTYFLVEETNDKYKKDYKTGKYKLVKLSPVHMLEKYRKDRIIETRS